MKSRKLSKKALSLLDEDNSIRIDYIKEDRWIGYTRAKDIYTELIELMHHPKIHRMPNKLIIGSTDNGKTMIVNHFVEDHPPDENRFGDHLMVPVLYVQAPPKPDESRFYNNILDRLFALYKPNEHVSKKQTQVINLLKRIETKVLIIDEIHHILAGHIEKQRAFLNVIKFLGNELKIPIVGVGTKDALRAIQTDPQLANRFEPTVLPRWTANNEYLKLLNSFEYRLPLKKPSKLVDKKTATKILALSEGTIGAISTILKKSAELAIKSGEERINLEVVNKINWIPPSERLKSVERIA